MSLKGKLEAIIYAAEEPVTVDQMAALLKDAVLADLAQEASNAAVIAADAAASDAPATQPAAEVLPEPEPEAPADAPSPESAPEATAKKKLKDPELTAVKAKLRTMLAELVADYQSDSRGLEIRQVAGGYRMATKPEHHDVVVGFAKSLKPPIRLSLQALETLAVVAYKQPVTAPEVSEIRGVDSSGVISTLLDRKLVTTAGRKQVIGRPILYKTTKEFLLRFGLKDVNELPSMEEFEKLGDAGQGVMFEAEQSQPRETTAPAGDTEAKAERVDDAMMAHEDQMVATEDRAAENAAEANESQPEESAAQQDSIEKS
ncbi:MAG TPA: SMC-Scp complex subunit ScpB [Candidatus Koribacter sp.]|jgi:segregation and condensation protein B